MYKSRLKNWKVGKYKKKDEMRFALKTFERRGQQGKMTCLTIRGQTLKESEIRKYFKRHKTTVSMDIKMSK